MSHFTVLVVTNHPSEVEAALQPYHEYECTGIEDEYVKFIACDDGEQNELLEEAQEMGITIEESAEEEGYEVRDGVIGRYTNPDAQWDWWRVGGRWSKYLKHRNGEMVDQCKKADVDFNGKIAIAEEEAAVLYDEVSKVIDGRAWFSWDYARSEAASIDIAREVYNKQQVIKDVRGAYDHPFFDCDQFRMSRDEYIKKKGRHSIETFAVLINGVWSQRGEMGWFGCVANQKEDDVWSEKFMSLLNMIGDDQYLTVVDCHI